MVKNATMLPDEDLKVLQALRIHVMYLTKNRHESYYDLQANMNKFLHVCLHKRSGNINYGNVLPL
jgi:hypothetical protein